MINEEVNYLNEEPQAFAIRELLAQVEFYYNSWKKQGVGADRARNGLFEMYFTFCDRFPDYWEPYDKLDPVYQEWKRTGEIQ